MKKKEILAALKSRIQPVENSEAGELRGGFAEFSANLLQAGEDNGTCTGNGICNTNVSCTDNSSCNRNSTCANNSGCNGNGTCLDKPTKSSKGSDILSYSTIF